VVRPDAVEVNAHGVVGEGDGDLGRGHDDGTGERERFGVVENIAAIDGDTGSRGESCDGAGDVGMELVDVIEGQDVVMEGAGEEVVFIGGSGEERRAGRVNEGADCAG
jgi:hypothetical protein